MTGAAEVIEALRAVHDPEYPGVSVVDMGMIGGVEVRPEAGPSVELITTFSGCPALDVISSDIAAAVGALEGVAAVEVRPSAEPWDTSRLSQHARTSHGRPSSPSPCPCPASRPSAPAAARRP